MTLSGYERFAFRAFKGPATAYIKKDKRMDVTLQRAAKGVRAESYLATTYLSMAVAALIPLVLLGLLLALRVGAGLRVPLPAFFLAAILVLIAPAVVYVLAAVLPEAEAANRARKIDARLPFASIFVATLATAGMHPPQIFQTLAQQPVFGEIARESSFIARDMTVLGKDLVTCFQAASERTPSKKLRAYLQGAITSLTSGVDIKDYFFNQSEQLFYEAKQDQKKFMDSLGILAESFITVVVAGTTFFIVLLSIMGGIGGGSGSFFSGYVLVLGVLPLIQVGFAVTIISITPED
ncbi:MAG TPA: type II secretion system F family protein [Candidatus Thermoplasmatota archaeon]|nr:type II secretion system F family protein [Candidatus Thermoplasmatota archaeon]